MDLPQLGLRQPRVQLDLVDGGHNPSGIDKDIEVLGLKIAAPIDRIRP